MSSYQCSLPAYNTYMNHIVCNPPLKQEVELQEMFHTPQQITTVDSSIAMQQRYIAPKKSLDPPKLLAVHNTWAGKRPLAQRENHIWSERERRKGMNRLFCILRSLLPDPMSKTDKSTVVGEIIKYITVLRKRIEDLSNKQSILLNKATRSSQCSSGESATSTLSTRTSLPCSSISTPFVAIHICNEDVFLNMSYTNTRPLASFANILRAMRQHQLILLDANVSTQDSTTIYCIHSKAMDINHFARESLHSALLAITQPYPNMYLY